MSIIIDNCIASHSNNRRTPDRFEVKKVGSIDCHYALIGNCNPSHPEQQDRAAIYALPNIKSQDFQAIMNATFSRMKETLGQLKAPGWKDLLCLKKEFMGDCCVTLTMFDPRTGNLAIGNKGDAAVYMLLDHKKKQGKRIIRRISSPFQHYLQFPEDKEGETVEMFNGPNGIGLGDIPIMWAKADDWQKYGAPFLVNDDYRPFKKNPPPSFELINIKALAKDILGQGHHLENYNISLLMASDGIEGIKHKEHIADALCENAPNRAQAVLNRAITDESKDNLSAVVLRNIVIGSGDPVAIFIGDGNYKPDERLTHCREGTQAAQAMCGCFENIMTAIYKFGMQALNEAQKAGVRR